MILVLALLACGPRQFTTDDEVTVTVPRRGQCKSTTSNIREGRSSTSLFDLDLRGGEYLHLVTCEDARGQAAFSTVILTGVPIGTDPTERMATDLAGRAAFARPDGPATTTPATLSGLPAVQIAGDLAWMMPIHRVTRAVVVEDVLFAAGVWGTREEMTARAEEVPAWLDAVRFHDLDAYRADR